MDAAAEITDTIDVRFDAASALQVGIEDYKVIGLWGTIGGDIEKQNDLMNKLSETANAATEAIPTDFINNLT